MVLFVVSLIMLHYIILLHTEIFFELIVCILMGINGVYSNVCCIINHSSLLYISYTHCEIVSRLLVCILIGIIGVWKVLVFLVYLEPLLLMELFWIGIFSPIHVGCHIWDSSPYDQL